MSISQIFALTIGSMVGACLFFSCVHLYGQVHALQSRADMQAQILTRQKAEIDFLRSENSCWRNGECSITGN